jgi:hypothetical protein
LSKFYSTAGNKKSQYRIPPGKKYLAASAGIKNIVVKLGGERR